MKILVIFTCFNRKEKTENCIKSIGSNNPNCDITFVVVDDNSSDDTKKVVHELQGKYKIFLLEGDGDLFYSGGMRVGMDYALNSLKDNYDYLFMCNDDVDFFDLCIEKMINQSGEQNDAVIVGAMQNLVGELSYGAVKYISGIKYRKLSIEEWSVEADTFNANAVLIPYDAFKKVGSIDSYYLHSLGDFDYGLSLKRAGYYIYSSKEYVGMCENNSTSGGWMDVNLSRFERFHKKESIKGAPTRQWFYFLWKNFGLLIAIRGCITPYIRILVGK